MAKKMKLGIFFVAALAAFLLTSVSARAQQTLGGITGTVTDRSGSVLPDTTVTIVGDQTKLTRTLKTNGNGAYDFVNLPIGTYTITVTHEGFESERLPTIPVQADRTATLNVTLKVGQVGTTIDVEAAPIMNAVDTTNGYVLESQQIADVPLPTGSFTGLAILSPGVSAELPSGTGANAGLGNQPIWANGQRDTSNTFLLNGVDASNSVQRQEHEFGRLGPHREQHGHCGRGQHDCGNFAEYGVTVSCRGPGTADTGSGNGAGSSREYFDV